MYNIFTMANAINESVSGGLVSSNVEPHEFFGSIDECTAEFNYIIMSETANFVEIYAESEDILAEAALSNPSALAVIQENVFTTIFENIKKIIDKIIAAVKGMIEKLKAFFAQLTGKTGKWMSIMRNKVTANIGKPGIGDLTYTGYNWETNYVINDISSVISDTVDEVPKLEDAFAQAVNSVSGLEDRSKEEMDKRVTKIEENLGGEAIEKIKDMITTELAESLGVEATSSNSNEMMINVSKKAHGGEKTTIKFSDADPSKMLSIIDGTSKTISSLKTAYDKNLKALQKVKQAIESASKKAEKVDKNPDRDPGNENKYKTIIQTASKYMITGIQLIETYANQLRGINIKLAQEMAKDYMAALTKFANFKAKKS